MKTGGIFFILSVALMCDAREIGNRIVGGYDAAEGSRPFQVSLRYSKTGDHFCGGVIIDKHWILTAAHCVVGESESSVIAVVGTNSLTEGGQSYTSDLLVPHEKFNRTAFSYDIAVIHIPNEIKFTDRISSIGLPSGDFDTNVYSGKVSGWGKLSWYSDLPDKLQALNLFVISQDKCAVHHSVLTNHHICTFTEYGQGVCHGDSGGPLTDDGQTTVLGLASFVVPCALGYPDVFTRVSTFVDWIHATMQTYGKK